MSAVNREQKGSSWLSQLPLCLKTLVRRTDEQEPRRTFRILHMPDRPARSLATQNIPTDEECLQHLLALQQQGMGSRELECGSEYRWQEDDVFPFVHGVGPSKREVLRMQKRRGARPRALDGGKIPGWDAVVTKSMSPPFTPDSSGPWGSWTSTQNGHYDPVTTTRAGGAAPPKEQRPDEYSRLSRAVARGTWPARDPRRNTGTASSKGVWTPVCPRSSLPPEARSDADDEDDDDDDNDVYDGWEEYYFDETNFRGRDEGAMYTGRIGANVGLPSIEEFI